MADDSGVWVKVFPDYVGGATGAAVIDSAVADDPDNYPVKTSSFTGDGTNGDKDQNYDVYEFLGSGELVVSEPGLVDVLVVAGGGGGIENAGTYYGGGAGGFVYETSVYLSDRAHAVTVGGGGGAGGPGNTSKFLAVTALFGGRGNTASSAGASSGGTNGNGVATYWPEQGGFSYNINSYRSGGGSGGDATNASAGVGTSHSITGSSFTYAAGGRAQGSTAGAANTGNGGGNKAKGGSGIVIVRVKVAEKSFGDRTRSATPKTAHAARVENGVVKQVITIPHLNDDDNKITEYCNKIGLPGTWVDTSYTGARRGKYAGVGDLFDPRLRNAEFISPVTEEAP